jgi:Na+-driven multidrug efflux pump
VWGIPGLVDGIGLDGIAISTVLCQTGVLVYMAWVSFASSCFQRFHLGRLRPDPAVLSELAAQILPGSARLLVIAVGGFVAQLWLRADGEAAVAAYNVGLRLEQLMLLPAIGITGALLPFTSQNMGAGRRDRVMAGFWQSTALAVALLLAGVVGIWTLGGPIVAWFGAGDEAEAMALDYLHIESFVFPLFAFLFGLQNLLQGLKRPLWPLVVGVWRQGVSVVVFGWLFVQVMGLGAYGLWLTIAAGVVTGTLFMVAVTFPILRGMGISVVPTLSEDPTSSP